MLRVFQQNHLACFDAHKQYFCSFSFGLVRPQIKRKDKEKDRDNIMKKESEVATENVQIQQKYQFKLYVDSQQFQCNIKDQNNKSVGQWYQWNSQYFDMEVKTNQFQQFGNIPFSLETYLQIYKDPKLWQLSLIPKNDDIQVSTVIDKVIGKLTVCTKFQNNPFILPVYIQNHSLQCDKKIKVIINAENYCHQQQAQKVDPNEHDQVISSGQLIQRAWFGKTDIYIPKQNQDVSNGYLVYTFQVNSRVSGDHICIIKGKFAHKELKYRNKTIHIYSGNNKPVQFIYNLQKTVKMLKFVDNDITIFQNIDTLIQDSHQLVFFTDLTTLYSRIFRSYLYSKIYDEWIIEGMVHYSRDNRHFQDCMADLTEMMTEGEQFFPLSNNQYSFDFVWKTKAKFIYHILQNLSNNNLTKEIIEYTKKKKMTSTMILKKMKDKFGVDKIKTIYEQQFINSTGMNRIFYEMEHIKREHKLKITLRQKSLQCGIFKRYNRYRIKLQELYRMVSPIMEKIIKKNQGKRSEMSGPLAVPKFLKCIPYFIGSVSIQIENSEPFFQQLQEQNITERITDQKASLRIKRTTSKKNESEGSDSISWMMIDSSSVYPAVYKGKNLSETVIQSLVKRVYESQVEELKVLNSISIKQHSESSSICKLLIQKVKIKPGKEDCKISVKRKIFQLLPSFLSKSTDPLIYDQILQLLQLYQPICYDYSEEGNLFLHALIQSIGNIQYSIKMSQYFQQFHRIFLLISKYHHSIFNEDKFEQLHRQLFKSMTGWLSKYSYKILQQAKNYLQITLNKPRKYLSLIKIITEKILEYQDMMNLTEEQKQSGICLQISKLINFHIKSDISGHIKAIMFKYETKKRQKNMNVLEFMEETFGELQNFRDQDQNIYALCLEKFKDVLNQNRERYAYQIQAEILNQNQNYFLAQYLWKQMCSRESRYNSRIRLSWMKIYRILYFYYTPIITMVKLTNNLISKQFPLDEAETTEILDNIMDFIPDIKWFSVYDSSNNKKKKAQILHNRKKKKQQQQFHFSDKNMFTVFVSDNPLKATWQDLSKLGLDYLKKQYENKQIEKGDEKFKKIVDRIKQISQKLKRGNMPNNFNYQKMKRKVFSVLEEFNQDLDKPEELFTVLEKTLRQAQQNKKRIESEQKGDTSVFIPLFGLNLGSKLGTQNNKYQMN